MCAAHDPGQAVEAPPLFFSAVADVVCSLAEKTRAELSLEIEKERAAAEQRAAAQRKELEVEPDPSRGAEASKP